MCLCTWGDDTGKQWSYTGGVCKLLALCVIPPLMAVSSGHWPVPSYAGRLWPQTEMWSSHSVVFFDVFLSIAVTVWTWTPCLSARSQKYCVCSLLNSCDFGRNVAGQGGMLMRQPPGYGSSSSGVVHSLLLPAAALPLASMEGQVYPQTLSPDGYKPKPRRYLLETHDGGVLVEKSSFPALSPAQDHCQ